MRTVAWSGSIEINYVQDLSKEDFSSDLWFSGNEMKVFKRHAALSLRLILAERQ